MNYLTNKKTLKLIKTYRWAGKLSFSEMFLNNVDLLLGSWFLSVLFCFFISMYKFLFFLINTFQFFLKSLVSSLVLHISTLQRPPVSLKSFISITQHVQCHTSNNQPTKKKKKSSGLLWAGQAEGTGHLQKDRLFYLYIKKVTVATMQTFTHRNKQPPSSQSEPVKPLGVCSFLLLQMKSN